MRPFGIIVQIGTIIAAILLVFLYTLPTFEEIGQVQSDSEEYRVQRSKVQSISDRLASHVRTVNGMSTSEKDRLFTYLPDELDEVHVMRDIAIIATDADLTFNDISYNPIKNTAPQDEGETQQLSEKHTFSLDVEGTYPQLKTFLSSLEKNEYPLEIAKIDIKSLNGIFLSAAVSIATYTSRQPVEDDLLVDNI